MTPLEIKNSALYKFCLHAYQEQAAWAEHEAVFAESLKEAHDEIRNYLNLKVERIGEQIHVSYILNEWDTSPVDWKSQVQNATKR